MNANAFEKGKKAFQFLLIILFRLTTITCQLNLFNTNQTITSNSLQYHCLNYHIYREKPAYQELRDVIDEVIPYCFRPENNFDETVKTSINPLSQKLSFKELFLANITAQQLLLWSAPIEAAERYQFYLNQGNSSLDEYFYNCSEPWFGPQCQYSFEFDKGMSFDQIIYASFHERRKYSESSNMMIKVPCYVLLKCNRNGQPWCLDWREVCNGNVDCFDEGLDEEFCFDMEINECKENEYRCHNGLCISEELWEDNGDPECLDRSDEVLNTNYIKSCFQDPTFRCEEHSCRTNGGTFSCGDGQCIKKFHECPNGRQTLLIDSITAQGNLGNECWIAMVCRTGFINEVYGSLCKVWLMNNSAYEFLKQCNSFFQFPTIPVHSGHVRLYYQDPHSRFNMSGCFLPDYVCYDPQLCDFIPSQSVHKNLTCLKDLKLIQQLFYPGDCWINLISSIELYFRPCFIPYIFHNKAKYNDHPSLYTCQNSSSFISKHRILDREVDCPNGDDEEYKNSCLLNHRHRVRCHNSTNCYSPLWKANVCRVSGEQDEISFQRFCDGIEEYIFYDNNGQTYSEELGCEDWCDNIYSRCDGFWTCRDGRDERNCSRTKCDSGTSACVSSVNYTVFCLAAEHVNDGIDHCLGASDEQKLCRGTYPSTKDSPRFRCSKNRMLCLSSSRLCDTKPDCPFGDDEIYCANQQFTCNQDSAHNRSEVEEVLCGLSENENHRIQYFSIHTLSNYPSLENGVIGEIIHWPTERHSIKNVNASQVENNLWPWYCNRGLVVHPWIENNSSNNTCMCPPSYYGDSCQYENQRISLTLQLTSNYIYATYAIVIMLIDDDDELQEINSYDQFLYVAKQSCSIKFNRYLLFSARPKNFSKNYIVRIDIFTKNELTYVGSWHLPVNFPFLPVNRLATSLKISNNLIQISSNCSTNCENGICVKYANQEKYFCRCSSGWSGIRCNILINCQECASNSLCIGSANNRSICVCPINRFGPKCLFDSTCPVNACQNNGQCLPADVTIPGSDYTCTCGDRFFGSKCQYLKAKLDISLNEITIPPYIMAYFFTISNESDPITTIILRKLTLFQHIVTFHIAMRYHMVIIQAHGEYYLAVVQQTPKIYISTFIRPAQKCISSQQLLNSTVLKMIQPRRIVHYYDLCRNLVDLTCFIDEDFLCFCTNEHQANCMKFNRFKDFGCLPNNDNYCANEVECLQDHPFCPSTRICTCQNCFFGNQCQFYAKGLGSTLDEILGYEFKSNTNFSKQPSTVKVGGIVTILICLIGVINCSLSIKIFSRKKSKEVGCGLYLLASSYTSLITVILFTLKFWFLFLSHQDLDKNGQQVIRNVNCRIIELVLKIVLYLDNWFNACVAVERTVSVIQGISFNKNQSKRVAKFIITLLCFIISGLSIPQLLYLRVYDDRIEERTWCVVKYSRWLQIYSSILMFFHYFAPLFINLCSAVFIIVTTACQRAAIQADRSFYVHLKSRLKQYQHLLISPAIIIILTLPHLIISIILDCKKSSDLFWFYFIGYFLSFIPASFVFFIFVLPSPLYKEEFRQLVLHVRRRCRRLKLNSFRR